jgi:hypothetical protein
MAGSVAGQRRHRKRHIKTSLCDAGTVFRRLSRGKCRMSATSTRAKGCTVDPARAGRADIPCPVCPSGNIVGISRKLLRRKMKLYGCNLDFLITVQVVALRQGGTDFL